MACSRDAGALLHDLPFRRDVLEADPEDQLRRDTEEQGISLLQFAAISDVMGLRAAPIQLTPEQTLRLLSCFGGGQHRPGCAVELPP